MKKSLDKFKTLSTKGIFDPIPLLMEVQFDLVPRKNGAWLMCINYKALNNIPVMNQYPLPRIYDFLDYLKDAKFFTKLDLKSKYHQIPIESLDVW